MSDRVPMRRCIVCRTSKEKKELIRLVKKDNQALIDTAYKLEGRGFYVCRNCECIQLAKKKKVFERFFEINQESKLYDELLNEV